MNNLEPYRYPNRKAFIAFCTNVSEWGSQKDLEIQLAAEQNGRTFYTIGLNNRVTRKRKREEHTPEEISLFARELLFGANKDYLFLLPNFLFEQVAARLMFVSEVGELGYICLRNFFNNKQQDLRATLTQELANEKERSQKVLKGVEEEIERISRGIKENSLMKKLESQGEVRVNPLNLLQQDEGNRDLTFVSKEGKINVHSLIFKQLPFVRLFFSTCDANDREISIEEYSFEAVQYFVNYHYESKKEEKTSLILLVEVESLADFVGDESLLEDCKKEIRKCQKFKSLYDRHCTNLLATQIVDPKSQLYLKLPSDEKLLKNVLLGNLKAICAAQQVAFEYELEYWIKFSKEQNLDVLITVYFNTKWNCGKILVLDQLRPLAKTKSEEFESVFCKLESCLREEANEMVKKFDPSSPVSFDDFVLIETYTMQSDIDLQKMIGIEEIKIAEQYDENKLYKHAFKWFQKAGDHGNSNAQNELGIYYTKGKGLEIDFAKSFVWFEKAANQGHAGAQYNLGLFYQREEAVEKNLVTAFEWFEKAANQGHAGAQYNLGLFYQSGEAVEQNLVKAFEWFEKAAEQGHANAQYNLGFCYWSGKGVEQNLVKAFEWFEKAAEQGDANAQCNLGLFYQSGEAVEQNLVKAFEWFEKAAEQGHANAQYNLGFCYWSGKGVHQNLIKARKWLEKAANQGHVGAQYRLGHYFWHGVEQNLVKARKWFEKAAAQGHAGAQDWLSSFVQT